MFQWRVKTTTIRVHREKKKRNENDDALPVLPKSETIIIYFLPSANLLSLPLKPRVTSTRFRFTEKNKTQKLINLLEALRWDCPTSASASGLSVRAPLASFWGPVSHAGRHGRDLVRREVLLRRHDGLGHLLLLLLRLASWKGQDSVRTCTLINVCVNFTHPRMTRLLFKYT